MKLIYSVYRYLIEDQMQIASFELEYDAILCMEYLQKLKIYPDYEGFYILEECYYESFNDYLMDVKSK